MKKLPIFLLLFLAAGFCVQAQDLIIKKDGTRIFCKIVQIDSNIIVYKRPPSTRLIILNRNDLQNYQLAQGNLTRTEAKNPVSSGKSELFIFGAELGQSDPIGNFGSLDLYNEQAGLAERGFIGRVSAAVKANEYIGFGLSYLYQRNRFADYVITRDLEATYPGSNFIGKAEPWIVSGVFARFLISVPLNKMKDFLLDVDVLAGIPQYQFPDNAVATTIQGTYISITQTSDPSRAITLNTGIGLSYKIAPNWALTARGNFLSGKPYFPRVEVRSNLGFYDYSSYTQKVTAIHFTAGISYLLTPYTYKGI